MPIVYEGVGGERGDLFNGLKLWISHRVPQRSRWIDLVKGNGGEVVPLEKNADMLIADNVKRAGAPPPPGAYTWKWIDYSVRNHFLQPTEDYLITPAAPRAVGSSAPAKGTRTPFTNHDDLVLTKFVLAKERAGEGTSGNEIYREFERKHPNHPWQSWRDRWVKILSLRPRPNLSDEESHPDLEARGSQGPGEQGQPDQPAVKPEPESTARQAQPPGGSALASPSPSPSKSKTKTRGRNFFTEEEDNLLLEYIREAQEYNKTVTGNKVRSLGGEKIYKEFAQKHPSHTYHSWRDRWVRHLSRREENIAMDPRQETAEEHVKEPKQRTNGHSEKSRHPTTAGKTAVPSGHVGMPVEKKTTAIRTPELPSSLSRPNAKSDDERLERQEQARRKARAAKLLQRTWRGYSVRRDHARFETLVVPLQSLVRGYLVRMRQSEKLLQASEAKIQLLQDGQDEEDTEQYEDAEEDFDKRGLSPEESKADDRSARDQFYDDLQDFIEVSGAEVDRQPVVDGRKVDLWDLFKAATQQAYNPEDRNWKEIAEELGFDWTKSARCLLKLLECYNRNLADFEEAIKSYDNMDDVEEEKQQQQQMEGYRNSEEGLPQTSNALTAFKEPSEASSSHVYQSSPPVAGVKRSFQHSDVLSSDLGYPSDDSRKRRRLDQRTEIPPTPEDKLGWRGLAGRGGAHDKSSPLKPRGSTAAQPFDIDSARVAEEVLDGDMEDIERLDELPEHPSPQKKKYIEPETQDFGFALGSDVDVLETAKPGDYDYMADEDDISPSQQLRIESDTINSTPNSTPRNGAPTTNWHSLAAPRPRPDASTSRPASSNPRTAVINAAGDSSRPSGLVNGKTTKRSLPQIYQKPSASAPGRTYGFAQIRNGTAQPRPGPNSSAPGRVPVVTPRGLNGATSRTQQSIPSTTALSKLSSPTPMRPSSRRAPPSTAPSLPQNNRNGLKRSQSSDTDNDPAVVDAQFAHFEALGYEKAHIGRALEAATFQRGPMTVALQSLHDGHGLPRNEPGVWTDHDDEKLKSVRDYDRRREKGKYIAGAADEDERQRVRIERYRAKLTAKHGEWMEPRLQFMDMMDQGNRG
ncbi:Telomeric repeat-binding factor 2-interacting protein 1 [Cytospora mali]|uniref:Telomeric repeat-binding factor 2-interacting protein 1 n=1 Tax=Cytospora mali TaxID=578113 RepID=A0A194UX64_CYTMA|nr:Telomeric repeat-binding factor 2-interacting protein 1 [Valsa mali var. pyri (nom. inval.)]